VSPVTQFQELRDVVASAYKRNGYELTYNTCSIKQVNGKFIIIINMKDPDVPNFFYILQDIKKEVKELGYEVEGDSFFYERCTLTLK